MKSALMIPQHAWSIAPTVLLVDDDAGTRETMEIGLSQLGFHVLTARTAHDAVTIATRRRIDCLLVDHQLPDMIGTDFVRTVRSRGVNAPFAVISGFLAVPAVVDAMRLGARSVLEKPIDVEQVAVVLADMVGSAGALDDPTAGGPGSVAARWAGHAEKACQCASDPKTLEHWARAAGVSYSSLCETCRLLSIRSHDARDFVRVLRALMHARRLECPAEALLDVCDRRTLATLLHRSGVEHKYEFGDYSVSSFLERQTFIDGRNQGLRRLIERLQPSIDALPCALRRR
jgi:CheY-like chemotaxis protein